MLQDELKSRYFEWLYSLVYGVNDYSRLTYRKLLLSLHEIEFIYDRDMDRDRASDGVDLRYRFGYENGYSAGTIEQIFYMKPCSVLEMMIALASKGEEQIMKDDAYGDRTGQWFWNMIVSLGLGSMHDNNFNNSYIYFVISKFLHREYKPNGEGGLFTIENCKYDLRNTDIWTQYMWYLNTIIEGI